MGVIFRRMMQFHKIGTQRRKISDDDFSLDMHSISLVKELLMMSSRQVEIQKR